jgi:hypothetical protein
MKRGSGVKDRDDKSNGMEISMTETFDKINPTDPLILAKQSPWRKRNDIDPIPPVFRELESIIYGEYCCLLLIDKARAKDKTTKFIMNQDLHMSVGAMKD